jgi:cytochrome c-type biogenesis protein CcmH/NrfG
MKINQILLAGTLFVSVLSFAQKDELKTLKKIYAKDAIAGVDLQEYKAAVAKLEPLATEESDKVYAAFYKCMTPVLDVNALGNSATPLQIANFISPKNIENLAAGLNATLDFEKKSGKKIYTDDINETIASFNPAILNVAITYGTAKKYNEAASLLHSIYQMDKKEQDKLYYAANYAVNGQDYDKALQYYNELKTLNYTGEETLYYAKNIATGQEESYNDKSIRDKLVAFKTHNLPREEKTTSKKGEVYKNIALILIEKGKTDEAKTALADARKANPEDTDLILNEADIYFKLNDMVTYKKLINEALEKKPNDPDLNFNLGVVSGNASQFADAEKYYSKVIELKPDYTNAYLNLADIKLKPDAKMVEEINKLGTTDKDLKRYEVLKADRQKLFNAALPLLEKAYELSEKMDQTDPKNKDQKDTVKSNLLTVYNFLEMRDKYKELKAKI